jgi:isopentenyl diphosphate isomerase/L-lactate dehydrogenase-like FMN-dependent dehydrogenase
VPNYVVDQSRRRFFRLLAASPILPWLDLQNGWIRDSSTLDKGSFTARFQNSGAQPSPDLISAAGDAASVLDFEPVARAKLSAAHFEWMSTGGDDGGTIRANRAAFDRYELRARRLVDVSKVDTSVSLLGTNWETPIFLCPVSGHRMYNPEGELATARAAKSKKHLQMLSTMTTTPVEEVNAARGEPVWFQLYNRNEWTQTLQMIKRVEAAGCPALVFTIDLLGGRNMEQFTRVQRRNRQQCAACHMGDPLTDTTHRPMITALTSSATSRPEVGTPTWDYAKRLKDSTSMKLLVKGIGTHEDAELALEHGVNAMFVSNHGGRSENSLRSSMECLADVVAGVKGRVPVIVDSGFRRGTDIFKALALGATAAGVGRPYIWGLTSFGQEGVETVLDLLRRELQLTMRQMGATSIGQIKKAYLVEKA